jgi:hypothetical protein
MKILLISLPRTGSTSLLAGLAKEFGLQEINEPFEDVNIKKYEDYDWQAAKKICVKTHIHHRDFAFYIDFIKYFERVILLSRKNLRGCAESLAYSKFHHNYTEKYEWVKTPNLLGEILLVKEMHRDLERLSKSIGVEISFYEDLYDPKSAERLRKEDSGLSNLI